MRVRQHPRPTGPRRAAATLVAAALALGTVAAVPTTGPDADLARLEHVDPMIGSVAPGFTNPGPALPHGMVGLGPDTEGPLNYGGYFANNTVITGFSHTHMSAGVFHAGHVPLMPVVGDIATGDLSEELAWTHPVPAYASPFDHATEVAEVGYYAVTLERYATRVELSATERAGIQRYTLPAGQPASVVVDLSRSLRGYDEATATLHEDGTLTGSVTTDVRGAYTVHTAIRVDREAEVRLLDGTPLEVGVPVSGDHLALVLDVGDAGGVVNVKAGLSYTDQRGAITNLDAELPGWDLDEVRQQARDVWADALAPIEVSGGTPADLTSFYTALYHAQLFPNLHSDVDGRYRWDDGVERHADRPRYSQFSLWDSYPGQNQLLAVIDPDRYRDMIASLLDLADVMGRLPRWQLAGHDASYMSGDPAIPFIAEGWCRGLVDDLPAEDQQRLLREMVELTEDRPASYDELGYLPVRRPESELEVIEGGPGTTGTSLENGLAEFALALVADREHRQDVRAPMLERATYYRNLVDPETGFVRPRHDDGSWLEFFHPELGYGFQEGTSWQYSWLAMQDMAGLIDAMGGRDVVVDRLDTFFSFPATATVPVVPAKVQNQATAFGVAYYGNQYAPGNEHDLEAPFVYAYAGAPWKTQAVARGAASVFTATPDGLPGNDDLGGLSGWLVWTMLGLYPMTPGAPMFVVASPVFTDATIRTGRGDIRIGAPGASAASRYVQEATFGGAPLDRAWVTEEELLDAGSLTLTMGPLPDTTWGAAPELAPPSLSTAADLSVFGCR